MEQKKRELSCENCKYRLFCEPYLTITFLSKDKFTCNAENCTFYVEGKSMPSFLPLFFPRAFHIRNVKWEKWEENVRKNYDYDDDSIKAEYIELKKKIRVAICRPYWKHLFQKFPSDWKHQLHKWTAGMVLIDHKEPDGRSAFESHKDYILAVFKIVHIVHKKYPKI